MWQSAKLHFAADHPTAEGHFPGNPVIPGALLLDGVVAAIAGEASNGLVVRAAKFLLPIRPGERMDVRWRSAAGAVKFECQLEGRGLAMSGIVEMGVVRI